MVKYFWAVLIFNKLYKSESTIISKHIFGHKHLNNYNSCWDVIAAQTFIWQNNWLFLMSTIYWKIITALIYLFTLFVTIYLIATVWAKNPGTKNIAPQRLHCQYDMKRLEISRTTSHYAFRTIQTGHVNTTRQRQKCLQ